jgi:hypothetical protein
VQKVEIFKNTKNREFGGKRRKKRETVFAIADSVSGIFHNHGIRVRGGIGFAVNMHIFRKFLAQKTSCAAFCTKILFAFRATGVSLFSGKRVSW